MISDSSMVRLYLRGSDNACAAIPRAQGEAAMQTPPFNNGMWGLIPLPGCACCGSIEVVRHANGFKSPFRCAKHADRNPCLIEGCTRTASAKADDGTIRLANNQIICGSHWRRYVPAGSRMRRAYRAHFRRAKRLGRNAGRIEAFWRFWELMARAVRRRSEEGHLDETEINRIMGWEQEA